MLNSQQIKELLDLAGEAAQQAGQYISAFDRATIKVDKKVAGCSLASQVVTQVDLACEALIHERLQPSFQRYQLAFLGEEGASAYPVHLHPRLNQPYFWCVDPLDGTLPFSENVPGYSVSIALVTQSGEAILGVVYDPVTETLYQGAVRQSALGLEPILLKQGKPWRPTLALTDHDSPQVLSLFFDRGFVELPFFARIKDAVAAYSIQQGFSGIEIHHQAGSVMNGIQVLAQAPACYFKLPKATQGGGCLWDFAATSALASAAGGWVSDIYGEPLQLNSADSLFMNRRGVLYASDQRIAAGIMQSVGQLLS